MKKINLAQLEKQQLENKEMNVIKGGNGFCYCGCYYRNSPGGSSEAANYYANTAGGLISEEPAKPQP